MRSFLRFAVALFDRVRGNGANPQKAGNDTPELICVGLGNPGLQYEQTRHNAGFMAIDTLVSSLRSVREFRCESALAWTGTTGDGKTILLAKPQTFMNDSGRAVKELLALTGLSPSACLVIVDDFHLTLGRMRFRKNGSDGGHNGLKSIISEIGQDFPRLRVGIGPVSPDTAVIDFVLGVFTPEEKPALGQVTSRVAEAVSVYLQMGIDASMSKYN